MPWVNYGLMVTCGLVFGYELSLGGELVPFVREHGFVSNELTQGWSRGLLPTLVAAQGAVTAMFIHGGWLHIIGNLLYLRVFGDNVEDRLGPLPFLLFYLACGVAGTAVQFAINPEDPRPHIGASGAISGVLGAYLVLFPRARVVTLFPIFIFLTFIEVPAWVFLGVWAAQQGLYGFLSLDPTAEPANVGWFAHLGGFGAGLLVATWLRIRKKRKR